MTALSGSPPRYTPTIHANASDTTPMFTLVTMLSVTATNSAASEIQAIGIQYSALQQRPEEHGGMGRAHVREMRHLMAARGSRGDQHCAWGQRACRRQELQLANRSRYIVMLTRITKGSGHPAAPGIQVGHCRARNA